MSEGQDVSAITSEVLGRIERETLFLWTSHNPSTTAETARRAAASLRRGQFIEMSDCAHWPQWEDPDTFNDILRHFCG